MALRFFIAVDSTRYYFLSFNKSRISASNNSSLVGSGSGAGAGAGAGSAALASSLRLNLPIKRITVKIHRATMIKSKVTCKKLP